MTDNNIDMFYVDSLRQVWALANAMTITCDKRLELFKARLRPNGDCLEWSGWLDKDGYGRASYQNKSRPTHRMAWMLQCGPIPAGMLVLHSCDNPPCCNIDHLRLGTQSENIREAFAKGRKILPTAPIRRGEDNNKARLTEAKVRIIRSRYAAREANSYQLASEYDVSRVTINHVVRRKTWKHI